MISLFIWNICFKILIYLFFFYRSKHDFYIIIVKRSVIPIMIIQAQIHDRKLRRWWWKIVIKNIIKIHKIYFFWIIKVIKIEVIVFLLKQEIGKKFIYYYFQYRNKNDETD